MPEDHQDGPRWRKFLTEEEVTRFRFLEDTHATHAEWMARARREMQRIMRRCMARARRAK